MMPTLRTPASDSLLVTAIKALIAERPSYGYRRVTALLNKQLDEPINHKRIYRIMKENSLLLQRYHPRPNRTHTGQVITLNSNMRWCSDAFTIQCWNGDRVHVAFSLDTCDREVLSYVASTVGLDGAAIRDLMLQSVEYRFGKKPILPHKIQWLSDNGPQYTAKQTVYFGRALGFEICTTPAYSPESNGMSEAFVKIFKRDYAWFGDLSDAQTVMKQLPAWLEDYNERAPHKGLKMRSPSEFIKSCKAEG